MKLKSPFLDRKAKFELVSLMDIMFIVLVFFIYSIFNMSVQRGMKVRLPEAKGVLETGERIVVTIAADGRMQLNGRDCARDALLRQVTRLYELHKNPVMISADRALPLGDGIGLLSDLKKNGVEKVAFQVRGENVK